jgi:nucleoid-associated protein YgaU
VSPATPAPIPVGALPATRPVNGNYLMYTTRSGDTLWRIAVTQVGSHAAVAQVMELNKDVLKGSDRIKPGMKLRLPTRSLASGSAQANGSF